MTTISIGNGSLQYERVPPPVTLPAIAIRALGDKVQERASHLAERRTIRAGLDAWRLIDKTGNSFENWKLIGLALLVGKNVALRTTGVNQARGANYSRAFGQWTARLSLAHQASQAA